MRFASYGTGRRSDSKTVVVVTLEETAVGGDELLDHEGVSVSDLSLSTVLSNPKTLTWLQRRECVPHHDLFSGFARWSWQIAAVFVGPPIVHSVTTARAVDDLLEVLGLDDCLARKEPVLCTKGILEDFREKLLA